MKPVDFRNATFADLQDRLQDLRLAVYDAYRVHGPGTTAEIAERSCISILNVRPRTNELFHVLGFLTLAEEQPVKGEATYRVRTHDELCAWIDAQRELATNPQRELPLNA